MSKGDKWGAFVSGSGTFGNVSGAANLSNFNFETGGVTAGLDYRFNDQLVVGVYGGYGHTEANYDLGSRTRVDAGKFGLYGTWYKKGFYVDGIAGGSINSYEMRQNLNFSGINRTAVGNLQAWEFDGFLDTGYDWQIGRFTFGIFGSLQYVHLSVDGFTETNAGALSLAVAQNSAESLRQQVGARLGYVWKINSFVTIAPEIRIAWQHEYLDRSRTIFASLDRGDGPGLSFTGAAGQHDDAYATVGLNGSIGKLGVYLLYNSAFGSSTFESNAVAGGVRFQF